MKTKIVYCLVSDNKDYYYEQLLISLCSLRKHNPNAIVEIVCDNDTFNTLKDNRYGIHEYNVNVVPVETPNDWKNWERSRFIKTNLRNIIVGDYLFIDTDTIITDSLNCIDSFSCEVGAVCDSHVNTVLPKYKDCKVHIEHWIWNEANKANIDIEGLFHYNSGVFYVKDTPLAHELYERWNYWYKTILPYGSKIDQLPLILANRDMNMVIEQIPSFMNCQVIWKEGAQILPTAKIIHYFPRQGNHIISSHWLLDPIKDSGIIPCTIMSIIEKPVEFFSQHSKIINGIQIDILKTPIVDVYTRSPYLFTCFCYVGEKYHKIKNLLRKVIY